MSVAIVHDYFTQRGARSDSSTTSSACSACVGATRRSWTRRCCRRHRCSRRAHVPAPNAERPGSAAAMAPLLPLAFRGMSVGTPEVGSSSSSAFAHHVRPPGDAVQIVYCHTPPRSCGIPRSTSRRVRRRRARPTGPGVLRRLIARRLVGPTVCRELGVHGRGDPPRLRPRCDRDPSADRYGRVRPSTNVPVALLSWPG